MENRKLQQKGIHLGTHGEKYGNWMSAPVFYMVAGFWLWQWCWLYCFLPCSVSPFSA